MKWKDIFLGALITLIVTIIGGVAVYFITREPKQEKTERLVYSVEQPTGFETSANKLAISNIRIANLGNLVARNVRVGIEFPQGIKIVDKAISSSSGDLGDLSVNAGEEKILIAASSFLPDETITVTLLLNSMPSTLPRIAVKSDTSLGMQGSLVRNVNTQPSLLNRILPFLLPLLVLIQIPLVLRLRKIGISSYKSSLNNAGFLHLHKGLIGKAEELLQASIKTGQYNSLTLSNYALCVALQGNLDLAKKYLDAAIFFGPTAAQYPTVMFNSSLINLLGEQPDLAFADLKTAIEKSRREILSYCKYSSVFADLYKQNPALRDFMSRLMGASNNSFNRSAS